MNEKAGKHFRCKKENGNTKCLRLRERKSVNPYIIDQIKMNELLLE